MILHWPTRTHTVFLVKGIMWDLWAFCSRWLAEVTADQYNQLDLVLRWSGLSTEEKHHVGGTDEECSAWLLTSARRPQVDLSTYQCSYSNVKDTNVKTHGLLCFCFLFFCMRVSRFTFCESCRSSATVAGLHPRKKNKTKKYVTWSVRDTDLTEHRKINVCTSATLPPAEVKNGTAMEEFHIQVENKRRHPMLASPSRTPLGTHRWNTLTWTILVASHVTLYIQV